MRPNLAPLRPTFWQAAFAGSVLALVSGLTVGSYFKAGYRFEQPLSGSGGLVYSEEAAAPVQYMTDASGRIPDYVLGTDFTAQIQPPPVILADYTPQGEPDLGSWESAAMKVIEIQPVATAPVAPAAPPPSIGGDILAGVERVESDWSRPEPKDSAPAQVVLEDGAEQAAFRREPQLAVMAAF